MFRRGLDILDLDPITYEMLSMNPNSMGYWLPPLIDGIQKQRFFKVPKTKVIKVPLTLLQLGVFCQNGFAAIGVFIANLEQ